MIQKHANVLAVIAAAYAVAAPAGAAHASDITCTNAPQAQWRKIDDVKPALVEQGFDVVRVQIENTCYEAYARTKDGRKVEVFIDPVSFAIVTTKDKS